VKDAPYTKAKARMSRVAALCLVTSSWRKRAGAALGQKKLKKFKFAIFLIAA
jgi:hypothetical protein